MRNWAWACCSRLSCSDCAVLTKMPTSELNCRMLPWRRATKWPKLRMQQIRTTDCEENTQEPSPAEQGCPRGLPPSCLPLCQPPQQPVLLGKAHGLWGGERSTEAQSLQLPDEERARRARRLTGPENQGSGSEERAGALGWE